MQNASATPRPLVPVPVAPAAEAEVVSQAMMVKLSELLLAFSGS